MKLWLVRPNESLYLLVLHLDYCDLLLFWEDGVEWRVGWDRQMMAFGGGRL